MGCFGALTVVNLLATVRALQFWKFYAGGKHGQLAGGLAL